MDSCNHDICASIPDQPCMHERRTTDEELLEIALMLVEEQHRVLLMIHQKHGGSPVFEDICCRMVSDREVTFVLAEAERRRDEDN